MNTKYDELFCLLSRQYDLTPLQAEMDEIITACSPFYAAEIARLEAEKAELLEHLETCRIAFSNLKMKNTAKDITKILEKHGRK